MLSILKTGLNTLNLLFFLINSPHLFENESNSVVFLHRTQQVTQQKIYAEDPPQGPTSYPFYIHFLTKKGTFLNL